MKQEKEWGSFVQLAFNQSCSVKVIEILPGKSTSLHYHHFREDLWYVLDDGVGVRVGDRNMVARRGDEFIVPAGTPHKLYSCSDRPVRVLEIAFGFTEEKDKVVVEDD